MISTSLLQVFNLNSTILSKSSLRCEVIIFHRSNTSRMSSVNEVRSVNVQTNRLHRPQLSRVEAPCEHSACTGPAAAAGRVSVVLPLSEFQVSGEGDRKFPGALPCGQLHFSGDSRARTLLTQQHSHLFGLTELEMSHGGKQETTQPVPPQLPACSSVWKLPRPLLGSSVLTVRGVGVGGGRCARSSTREHGTTVAPVLPDAGQLLWRMCR